jgi:hypothetical protein
VAKPDNWTKQNEKYDHHDDKLKAKDFDTSFGSLDPSSTDDGAGPTGNLTVGTGIPATNFNIFVNHDEDIELGLKLHERFGTQADIIPTSIDPDGTAHYQVAAGHQGSGSGERAMWNFDFSVNTGIEGSTDTLDHFDFRIIIASSDGERGVFNLEHVAPGVTPWLNGSGQGFADDDGFGPGNHPGGSPQISQNSVNLGFGFLQAIFGSDYDDAGEHYDIELQAFDGLRLVGNVHMSIDVV